MVVFQSAQSSFRESILSNPHPYLTCSSSFLRAAPSQSLAACRRVSAHLLLLAELIRTGSPYISEWDFCINSPFLQNWNWFRASLFLYETQKTRAWLNVLFFFLSFPFKFKTCLTNLMFAVSVPHLVCQNAKVLPEAWVRLTFVLVLQAGLQGSEQFSLQT